ncbi:MAG: N-acetylglucosamine-6-phosphate deacetylase, partial [Lachnospiraceae bacterium]|nr:N-acetylglucosamine-6-phosphate deacetylase [Lachnospiraceae bacterium]
PASVSLPYEDLDRAFKTAVKYTEASPEDCSRLLGINMEGPFFSSERRGAHNPAFLRDPDIEVFCRLFDGCGGLIKLADIAPELPGAVRFIKKACTMCRISAAHTDASYDEAVSAFDAGVSHLTHLFNGMPPLHHRSPGVIGAASERSCVTAELICDGTHIHPSVVRMAFRLFPGRICLISDSIRCCGMPDGEYSLGGQSVFLKDGTARLKNGTIAGSVTNLFDCMKNAISFGIPEYDAITAATLIPARVAGADKTVGSIEVGKAADFLVCDDEFNLLNVTAGTVPS